MMPPFLMFKRAVYCIYEKYSLVSRLHFRVGSKTDNLLVPATCIYHDLCMSIDTKAEESKPLCAWYGGFEEMKPFDSCDVYGHNRKGTSLALEGFVEGFAASANALPWT